MQISKELARATDEHIERAIAQADPLILRGLLYQLTGNDVLIDMPMNREEFGYSFIDRIADPADVATIQRLAVEFLKHLRDNEVTEIDAGPEDRLPRSLGLIAGAPLPTDELGLWIEETGLDPLARGLQWRNEPTKARKEQFQVVVIGGGISGINAAVHLKSAGVPFVLIEKNPEVGGTWYENRYPGIRVDTPSRGYLHLFGLDFPYPYAFCPGEENLRYMKWVVERYGLAEHIVYDTEVDSVIWDESSATWAITAKGPDGDKSWRAN
ncbi:MAG: FAD-dependent oxidoreductase, partial [Acidimicrobiia bacterium]